MKNIYAHKKDNNYELLAKHISNTIDVFNFLDNKNNIKSKIKTLLLNLKITKTQRNVDVYLSNSEIEYLICAFEDILKYHDAGKINPAFQKEKMGQNITLNEKQTTSSHSLLSVMIYLNEHILSIPTEFKEKLFIKYILLLFGNVILSHHTKLKDIDIENFKQGLELIQKGDYLTFYDKDFILEDKDIDIIDKFHRLINTNDMDLYILIRIAYSTLITCDFLATNSFYNEELDIISLPNNLNELFNNSIKQYQNNTDKTSINYLRNEIFKECVNNLEKNQDKLIYNLESPTGSGKTITSLGCVMSILEHNKGIYNSLLYIAPYNSISNQTYNTITNIFGADNTCEINSISPIVKGETYNSMLLNRQILNYPIVFSSNIKLFDMFFGCSRESSLGFLKLCNSIIVLDEIQSYNNKIWIEFIEFLNKYAEILNIKIIIMSATMPNIENLLSVKNKNFCDLINNPNKYFSNEYFKDRVMIDTFLLEETVNFDIILNKIKENISNRNSKYNSKSKFMIEFIKKKTAKAFYQYVKDRKLQGFEIYEIDGDDNILYRNYVIDKCNESNIKNNILLITTQTFECGVDIDMDLGAKDCSFPDLEEQFMGRINRSNTKKDCIVFFFNYDREEDIYKDDYRVGSNIRKEKFEKCLIDKTFKIEYEYVFRKIDLDKRQGLIPSIDCFYNLLKFAKYNDIEKYMKLITNNTIQIYIPYIYKFMGKQYDGYDIWKQYINLINDKSISFAERKVKIHNLRRDMAIFTYNVYLDYLPEDSNYGGIYLIEDGQKYINNNKFDSEMFYFDYKK